MLVICLLFSLIRPHHTVVYAPKSKHADRMHAPPPIGKGLFAWFSPIVKTKEDVLVDKVGLDAAVFLRFTRMCRNMFLALSIAGCGILIPVHVTKSTKFDITGVAAVEEAFSNMTPQNVSGEPMWSHVVVSYIFDIIICYFLWTNYRAVARLRKNYFLSRGYQESLHSRSIWITDIAAADRSDEGILRIADTIKQTASVPRPTIARNVKELPKLIKEHEEAVTQLESVLAKYLKNPDKLPSTRPTTKPSKKDHRAQKGVKLDAIDYLTERIKALEIEIEDVRETVDKRNPTPYGFATYDRIEEAHSVAIAGRKTHPNGATIRLAPRPIDLIWDNLPLSKRTRSRRRLLNNFWIALLTIVWIVPNALIAIFLTNLSNLKAVWPAFRESADKDPQLWTVVQAIASPALLSLVYLLLPILFRRLSTRAGDLTKTLRERHVTQKLYAFFVFNNLIVFSIFSTLWKFVVAVINNQNAGLGTWTAIDQAGLPNLLMVALCSVSPFWVTWLLQRNLGAAIDLAQLISLTSTWFARTFMAPTPRQAIAWTAPPPFDYASYYNYFLFYATVAMCYATVQPLVLPITCFYYGVDAWLKKYLLLYVFITKTESGGQFWNILFNRVLFATFLANLVAALVIKGALGSWTMLFCMIPLPILLIGFKYYCKRTFADQCKYYTKALSIDPESSGKPSVLKDSVEERFGHPALHKDLIAPMVHAKAQHLLPALYRGRTDSDGSADVDGSGYSDIAMNPMSSQVPGKPAAGVGAGVGAAREMFEVVPESNLDFAYFKNRAEFSEEHGGLGQLYGRPLDAVPGVDVGGPGSGASPRAGTPQPAFRAQGGLGGQTGAAHPYSLSNDSEVGLVGAAQPVGYAPPPGSRGYDSDSAREVYGLDRWRTGGSGYVGLSGQADEEGLEYEAYRPPGARGGGGDRYQPL